MKKTVTILLTVLLFVAVVFPFGAVAADANAVELYILEDAYTSYISIPQSFLQSYQISDGAGATYKIISGTSAQVDKNGLVTPNATTYYWYGNVGYSHKLEGQEPTRVTRSYTLGETVIEVTKGAQKYRVSINVNSYGAYYANQVMDDFLKNTITADMSDYQKLDCVAKFTASFEYSASYSGATSMIICGGGDCWASTDLIVKLSQKLGFDSWSRNGNRDPGAGSGHMNAMVQLTDGTYYEVEAGYYEPAPRYYSITLRTSLYSYRYYNGGIEIYQYDGKSCPADMVIPAQIDGKTVNAIGEDFISRNKTVQTVTIPNTVTKIADSAFNSCENLVKINLPTALESLGNFVFANCPKLTEISGSSAKYIASAGTVYSRDMTVLYYAPAVSEITVPQTVHTVAPYAFYYNSNIEKISLPTSVTKLGEGAFGDCNHLKQIVLPENGLTEVGNFAFANCRALEKIEFPQSVTTLGDGVFMNDSALVYVGIPESVQQIGDSAFQNCKNAVIYGKSASYAQTYAEVHNIPFVPVLNFYDADSGIYVNLTNAQSISPNAVLKVEITEKTAAKISYAVSLTLNGEPIPCDTAVTVKIPVPQNMRPTDCKVYRENANGLYTDMQAEFSGNYMVFTANSLGQFILTTETLVRTVRGDVNGDGKVNAVDARWILQAASGERTLSAEQNAAADVNGDGKINAVDARWILQVASGSRVL